jgi:hypothetical protein
MTTIPRDVGFKKANDTGAFEARETVAACMGCTKTAAAYQNDSIVKGEGGLKDAIQSTDDTVRLIFHSFNSRH